MLDEFPHCGEDSAVVGCCGQNEFSVTEGIFNALVGVFPCKVGNCDFGTAFCFQDFSQLFSDGFCMAVNRSIENTNALAFYAVRSPDIVEADSFFCFISVQNRAVKGTNMLNLARLSFFEGCGGIGSKFSHDSEVVAASFTRPAFRVFNIICAEFTESVCREENFVGRFIREQNFRPVNIRGCNKIEGMFSKLQFCTFSHDDLLVCKIFAKHRFHHYESHF